MGSEEPAITEQMTTAIVAGASTGMLVGGFLLESDVSLLLLLFGSVGVLTFVGDYLIRSALLSTLKENLSLRGRKEIGQNCRWGCPSAWGLALVAIVGSALLPGPALPIVLQVLFAVMSTIVVLFGSIVGGIRFYKKYMTEDMLNTAAGDMGLAITFTGSIGMATAGFLGGSVFGERFIFTGGVFLFVCFIVATVKSVSRIV